MKYFVYWYDYYAEDGGVGLEPFNTREEAVKFIKRRLKVALGLPEKKNYRIILGDELEFNL